MPSTKRVTRTLQGLIVAVLLVPWFAVACSLYDTSLLHTSTPVDSGSADMSATPEAADDVLSDGESASTEDVEPESSDVLADAPVETDAPDPLWCDDTCKDSTLARPPCPPLVPDPPSLPEPLIFAMRKAWYGMNASAPAEWRQIGLDMDCLNTGINGEPRACLLDPAAPVKASEDGDQGRDNSFGNNLGGLIRTLEGFGLLGDVQKAQNDALENGQGGLLGVIEEYGGGPDDPAVVFTVYVSRGTFDAAGTTPVSPVWDGNDLWSIDSSCLDTNNKPLYRDDTAYVSNWAVVAHLPAGLPIVLALNNATLVVTLSSGVAVARLSEDRTKIKDGVVSGVWNAQLATDAIAAFAKQNKICPKDPPYQTVVGALSSSPDIRVDLVRRPDLACNAISIAFGFESHLAKLGAVLEPPPTPPSQCGDE